MKVRLTFSKYVEVTNGIIGCFNQLMRCDNATWSMAEDDAFQIIIELFNAGTDTTATALMWSVLFLVNRPDIQAKLREELMRVNRCSMPV